MLFMKNVGLNFLNDGKGKSSGLTVQTLYQFESCINPLMKIYSVNLRYTGSECSNWLKNLE